MNRKEFGLWLKDRRLEKGLTQDQLAKAIGVKHSQEIAMFESGRVALPLKFLSALSKALSVPKEKILESVMKVKEQDLQNKYG
jgi:transcriptional regulator with XRE-family HTH domain